MSRGLYSGAIYRFIFRRRGFVAALCARGESAVCFGHRRNEKDHEMPTAASLDDRISYLQSLGLDAEKLGAIVRVRLSVKFARQQQKSYTFFPRLCLNSA